MALECGMQILLVVYLLVRDLFYFAVNFVTESISALSLFISSLL